VEGVGGERAAGQRGVRDCAPPGGVLRRLDDRDHGALAEHEAVPVGVERAAGAGRVVVAPGQGAGRDEAGEHHRGDPAVGAAADHDVGLAREDELPGLDQGGATAGAGQGAGEYGPADAQVDGDLTAATADRQQKASRTGG
jgi:hypothetical protein